jgi:hypothetical protein
MRVQLIDFGILFVFLKESYAHEKALQWVTKWVSRHLMAACPQA